MYISKYEMRDMKNLPTMLGKGDNRSDFGANYESN